jgi:hypothetical protein
LPSKGGLPGAVEKKEGIASGGKGKDVGAVVVIIPETSKSAVFSLSEGQQVGLFKMLQSLMKGPVFILSPAA